MLRKGKARQGNVRHGRQRYIARIRNRNSQSQLSQNQGPKPDPVVRATRTTTATPTTIDNGYDVDEDGWSFLVRLGRSTAGWQETWMDGFRAPLCACVSVCAERANEATRNKVKKEKKKKKGKLIMDENQKQKRQRRVEAEVEFELMQQGSYGGTNAHTQIHTATHSYKDCNERMTVGTNVARN